MQNTINKEQPEESQMLLADANKNNENNENIFEQTVGSLGKFKNTESLLTAYNNLQAEFTRKCQRLKELEKVINETENLTEKLKLKNEENDENVENNLENELSNKTTALEKTQIEPQKQTHNLTSTQETNIQSDEELLKNDEFIKNFINTHDDVKQSILKSYLEDLQKNKSPKIILSSVGSGIPLRTLQKPTNLEEAKEIVKKMFN